MFQPTATLSGQETPGGSAARWPALGACRWGGCAEVLKSRAKAALAVKTVRDGRPWGAAAHPPLSLSCDVNIRLGVHNNFLADYRADRGYL